jgi:hypothetical protein
VRAVHAEAHGLVEGTMTIAAGLPPEPARRLFGVRTGLAAHRPQGVIDRTRNAPSRHSAEYRRRFNGCAIHEPMQERT